MDLSESSQLESVTNSTETQSLISSDSITVREQVRECFKPRYRPRSVKNKGAILVIVWGYLTILLHSNLFNFVSSTFSKPLGTATIIAFGLTIPFAGWLADVRFGRYKIINSSIWTMWISALLLTIGQLVLQSVSVSNTATLDFHKYLAILAFPLAISFIAFQANIIQFGVDQLFDASSGEIKTFVMWYTWGILSSGPVVDTISMYASDKFKILASLLMCLNLTVAVSLNLIFKNVLIIEPVTRNPFKLVYDVIKYAVKNKSPRLRSAFTFCEDEKPSRIDFGKMKYGGPFTTEQVEDVKTLFRIIMVSLIMSVFVGISNDQNFGGSLRTIFIKEVTRSPSYIYSNFYAIASLVLIPLNEVFVHPLFYRCLSNLTTFRKFFIGGSLRFVYYGTLLALLTYARYKFIHNTNENGTLTNATLPCIFHGHPSFLSETLDYKWTILVEIVLAVSDLFMLVASIEFYCSQVPYSMKGLLAGSVYGMIFVFVGLSQLLAIPFSIQSITWGVGTLSCEFWYQLTLLLLILTLLTIFVLTAKWYKRRKREDVLPNEHIFAERYYSRE